MLPAPCELTAEAFLEQAADGVPIDVRAPVEFEAGHMPGAVNCPLFDDSQRAQIGTTYRQQGRQAAVMLGLELVGPRMRDLAEQVAAVPGHQHPLLYCARGGMRSNSMAWLLQQTGMKPQILSGGYKAYRKSARTAYAQPRRIVVLSGMTGAGKTQRLAQLAAAGEQVLDLERLAQHRGSSFGAIGFQPQPTCEHFQNLVYKGLWESDPQRVLWVEDESPSIGKVRVPEDLWWNMRRSPAIFLDVDRQQRAEHLAAEYGDLDRAELAEAAERLKKRLGGPETAALLAQLDRGEMVAVALGLLDYYDRTYQHAAKKRPREHVARVPGDWSTEQLIEYANSL